MSINWNRNQPIIHQLRMELIEFFPFFGELDYSQHWSNVGGFNNRTTRAGGFSAHSQGRAADIYLRADKPDKPHEKLLGDGLAEMFFTNITMLGVDHIMWDHNIWSLDKGGPRPIASGNAVGPHEDHVHVAFTRAGSQKQPKLLTELLQKLRKSLDQKLYNQNFARFHQLEGYNPDKWNSPYDTEHIKRATIP